MNQRRYRFLLFGVVSGLFLGCGGPSEVERENRKSFEALLTAISLKSTKELEKDAKQLDGRRTSGLLSEARHKELSAIIEKARSGEWGAAEEMAYQFRETQPFFK